MKNSFLFLYLLIVSCFTSFSQTKIDTVYIKYLDAKTNTTRESAAYYRVRTVSGNILKAEDYSMKDGTLRCAGYYKKFDPYVREGAFVFYYFPENIDLTISRAEGSYLNGIKEGVWKYYYSNGALWSTVTYREGLKNDEVKGYYKTGEIKRIEEYKKGKQVKEQCYTRDGKDTACYVVQIMPAFPGGDSAKIDYITKNVRYPKQAKRDHVEGVVFVSFVVNIDGIISDVEVVPGRGVHPLLDQAAIDCIKQMPAWTPGYQDGIPVKVKFIQRIKFTIQP